MVGLTGSNISICFMCKKKVVVEFFIHLFLNHFLPFEVSLGLYKINLWLSAQFSAFSKTAIRYVIHFVRNLFYLWLSYACLVQLWTYFSLFPLPICNGRKAVSTVSYRDVLTMNSCKVNCIKYFSYTCKILSCSDSWSDVIMLVATEFFNLSQIVIY